MYDELIIHKNRTNVIAVGLAFDVSEDTITSQIRSGLKENSELLVEFDVFFATDGTDGELLLVLDDEETGDITKTYGYMDLKRVTNGQPVSVFTKPLKVVFKEVVTA